MTSQANDYPGYLATADWKVRAARQIIRAGGRCEWCGSTQTLEVNHLTYARLGHERPEDLQVLCRLCHRRYHGRWMAVSDTGQPALFDARPLVKRLPRSYKGDV